MRNGGHVSSDRALFAFWEIDHDHEPDFAPFGLSPPRKGMLAFLMLGTRPAVRALILVAASYWRDRQSSPEGPIATDYDV